MRTLLAFVDISLPIHFHPSFFCFTFFAIFELLVLFVAIKKSNIRREREREKERERERTGERGRKKKGHKLKEPQ